MQRDGKIAKNEFQQPKITPPFRMRGKAIGCGDLEKTTYNYRPLKENPEGETIIWNELEQRRTDEIRMISVSIFMEMMIVMKP
jgi:hypothetical protein